MSRLLAFALAAMALAVVGAQSSVPLVIVNARVADLTTGRTRPVAAVVVQGQTISAVYARMPDALPEPATKVDAGGATLVPALGDVSMHAVPGPVLDVDFFYAMSLAHGVMRVRVVDQRLPWAVEQRARLAAGEVPGPRIWTSGPATDMRSAFGSRLRPVVAGGLSSFVQASDASALGREVARQVARGVDWVRLRENVPPDALRTAVAEARRGKVRVSLSAGATSMAQAAQAGVQLLDGLGAPLEPLGDAGTAAPNGSQPRRSPPATPTPTAAHSLSAGWAKTTPAQHRSLAAQLARAKVAIAPLLTWEHWRSGERQNLAADLDLLPKSLRAAGDAGIDPGQRDTHRQPLQRKREFVAALARAKASVVVGTGTTAEGWPVPGLGVLREIGLLVEAGLTPAEALRAATGAVAEVLGDRRGWQIMSGAQADFFAVKGDPLTDVGALADVTLVVRGGEVLDREALLARARKAVARP